MILFGRRFSLALVVLLAIAIWAWPSLTHWYRVSFHDNTYFYRVKVGLSHKGTKIDFDVVVGCNVRVSSDGYSGPSVDVLGWYPYVYAKAILGGHAVLLRTDVDGFARLGGGGPCQGATSTDGNGRSREPGPGVAADWLPVLVWYDHADDLSHGFAYVTQDAYASADAQLEFHGATIEHATRDEFDRFMATAPKNLVPRYLAESLCCAGLPSFKSAADVPPEVVRDPRLAWTRVVRPYCFGVERIRLNETEQARIRALWPVNHPRFWSVPAADQRDLLKSFFARDAKSEPRPYSSELFHYAVPDTSERRARRPGIFPVSVATALVRLNKDTGLGGYVNAIEIGEGRARLGMMSCDSEASEAIEEAVTGRPPGRDRLAPARCLIDGVEVPAPRSHGCKGGDDKSFIAFENDEYVITSWDLAQIAL